MEGYIKATPRLKWGYELAPDAEGMARPIKADAEALDLVVNAIMNKAMSLQEGVDYIVSATGKSLSREGLRKIVAEKAAPLKPAPAAPDWETNPDGYMRNEDGSFVLKKDGTPMRKRGKMAGYNYHSKTKVKMAVRKSISDKKKKVARLQAKVDKERHALNQKKEVAQRLDAADGVANNKPAIITEQQLSSLPPTAQHDIESGNATIAFRPHPGPQTDFLAASEKDVLYGGAAGGKDESFYRLLST